MRLPRLRSLLLLFTIVVLILPLAGIWFLRLYESALIRQTESELVAQAAVVAGAFEAERAHLIATGETSPEEALPQRHFAADDERSRPSYLITRAAGLDLAIDPVLSPPPDPVASSALPSELSRRAGSFMSSVLAETKQTTLAALRIADRSGIIVATTGDDLGLSVAGRIEVDKALAGRPVSVMRWRESPVPTVAGGISRASLLRVFVGLPVVEGDQIVGVVLVSRTPSTLAQAIRGKLPDLLLVGGALVAIGLALALMISRTVTRPLAQLVVDAKRVADGRMPALTTTKRSVTREVAELSTAVARMAETLDHRANYIRGFAAHVSHEFKTPLAAAKGAIELMSDHAATLTEAEQRSFLNVAADSVCRMEHLISRLLEFARADMMRAIAPNPVVLTPLLERLVADYSERGLQVVAKTDGAAIGLTEDAIEIVFGSLLDNALHHAGTGATVVIEAKQSGQSILVTVADSGPGISTNNAARIFEPFFTTRRGSGGTGLGLPIVVAILNGVGGKIELTSVAPNGAAFKITMPGG